MVPARSEVMRLKVDGVELVVDVDTLTMGERRQARIGIAAIEERDGIESDELDQFVSFVWVVLKRTRPEVTLDEVFDAVDIGSLRAANTDTGDGDDPEV